MKKTAAAVAIACAATSAGASAAQNSAVVTAGNARFTVVDRLCVRMEYSAKKKFVDEPSYFAANRSAAFKEYKLSRKRDATVIDTGAIRLEYTPDGKQFNAKNLKATIKKGAGTVEWRPGAANTGNLGGTIRTVDGVMGPVDLGEGVLSRDGWYLLDDSRRHILTKGWVEQRPADAGTDWYLFGYGTDYAGAIRAMTAIGGRVPMPRKYSLGAWYSRYWPYTSKEYRQIVKEYEKEDFPLDVMVMDMDWHRDGWTGWSWNRKLLPDAEELLKWDHEQGLAVTLNVHPADGVGPHEDAYAQFMKEMGEDPASKKTIPFDAGSKKYLDTLFKNVCEPLEKDGVDFWWLDWQQYPYTLSVPELTNLAWLNHYYFMHTGKSGRRGQSFSRWAGWGDHRHPIHFSGDAHTGWPMLAFEVPLTSTAGNIGAFFWSHDIGGHMGPRNEESYTRWVQFGATSAALRSHSTRSPELDRRPWKYPKWAENSMRISFHMRSEIFPYIYSSAWQAHSVSKPLNRQLYYDYPNEPESYKNPQEYFFGDSFLAAPVAKPGVGPRRIGTQVVRFPAGVWYNWYTGEKFAGGAEIVAAADIDEFPLYVKGGTPVPMQPYTQRMATEPLKNLVVRCWPGEDGKKGSFTLYEDDGISPDYLKGAYALTELSCIRKGDTTELTVGPAKGKYKGQLAKRAYTIELPCTKKAAGAKVNGKPARIEYDADKSMNIIRVTELPIDNTLTVRIQAAAADFKSLRAAAADRRAAGVLGGKFAGMSLRDAIVAYGGPDAEKSKLDTLFAIGGATFFRKNEAVYLYKGTENVYFFAQPGLFDGDDINVSVVDMIGESEKQVYTKNMRVAKSQRLSLPDLPEFGGEAAFGLPAKRVMKVSFAIGGRPFSITETIAAKRSWIDKWTVVGTFPYNRSGRLEDQKFAPEQGELNLKAVYKGFSDSGVTWRRAKVDNDNAVDFQQHFHIPTDGRIAYAVAFIDSDTAQRAYFQLNSDDGAQVWLNGKQILLADQSRSLNESADEFHGELKAGRNVLLVKISQQNNEWKFRAAIEAPKPIRLEWK